jgi:hypothetical protein
MIRSFGFLLLLLALALTLEGLHPLRFLKNELGRSGYHASSGAFEAPMQEPQDSSGLDRNLRRRFQKFDPALGSAGPRQHKDVNGADGSASGSILPVPGPMNPLLRDSAGKLNQDLFGGRQKLPALALQN